MKKILFSLLVLISLVGCKQNAEGAADEYIATVKLPPQANMENSVQVAEEVF